MAQKSAEYFRVHRTENVKRFIVSQFLPKVKRNTLIQQAQRVAHGAIRSLGNIAERLFLHLHLLFFHQFPQSLRNRLNRNPAEIIPLAAGKNRNRYLMHLSSRQNENHIGGGLFQRLQQRIKRTDGEHMHLVNDIDLKSALRRRIGHLIHNLTNIVHTVVGGGINLNHIHADARRNRLTTRAFPARTPFHGVLAVHRPRKYFRYRGFSRSPCPTE